MTTAPPILDRPYAANDAEASGKPAYRVGDDPLPYRRNVRGAALDLMILTYAAMRHARWLEEIGACPPDVAEQIRHHVDQIRAVVEPPVAPSAPPSSSPTPPHVGACPARALDGVRPTPASRSATRRNVGQTAPTTESLFNSHPQQGRPGPPEAGRNRRSERWACGHGSQQKAE